MSSKSGVIVPKGAYGLESRYEIVQHKYAGGGYPGCGGYIEVLEIKDPPEGKHPIVIYEKSSDRGCAFTEWRTLEDACLVFERYWGSIQTALIFPTLESFIRRVDCGKSVPWFYATEDDRIVGDCVVPDGYLF